jgi:hypothetical protein
MPDLPARPDLEQLRHQAKDLLRAAKGGDADAAARIARVSDRMILASAQLAIARAYGFASWPQLKTEVLRREVLDSRDPERVVALLAEDSSLAVTRMEHWSDHPMGASPLGYVAMMRCDTVRGVWRDLDGTGRTARALIAAGAPVDGEPGEQETPLITAASYGDAEVAKVLIEAGADVDARSAPNSGGVPDGTALAHAAVFGMTQVLDLLVAAGARIDGIEEAAAAGDISAWLRPDTDPQARIRALVMAADHERLTVIDELLAAGTPIDEPDAGWGRQALRVAVQNGRVESVRHLLDRGANPDLRDSEHGRTALDWCRHERRRPDADQDAYAEIEAMLEAVTS